MLENFIALLGETSTWRGITAIVTALGITLAPEQQNAITALGLAIIGTINVFRREAKKPVKT